jgi:tetratricopeptide (TPR) repeat protein
MSDDPKAVEAALYDADSAVRNARTPDPVFLRVRGHASLRNARYEDALKYANEALSDGDLACPNLLVKAGAYIGLDRLDEAREAYRAAMDSWPAHLKDKDSVEARAPKGVLWFEGEIWLSRLQAQVKASFGNDYRE